MTTQLRITIGQCTDQGPKSVNQDFHAVMIPKEPMLSSKGIAVALADGISSSEVSQIASETSVKGFLEDYYATPESWSVMSSVQRVLHATNSWLYSQTRRGPNRYNMDRGYVCTFSALVFKSSTVHVFSVGDTRIYRLIDNRLEQLTEDHRLWVSPDKSYLSRAMGMRDRLEIDYHSHPVEIGDTFILATDGVYEFVEESLMVAASRQQHEDLEQAARSIVEDAKKNGSDDNLTIQIVRIEELPQQEIKELHEHACSLPMPPELNPRMQFDGYEIVRELHHSSYSHVYLAIDSDSGEQVTLKVPSLTLRDDEAYLERFLMEEWVARRIDNVHMMKPCVQKRKRHFLYIVNEFIDGQTLSQWMLDNPTPSLEEVRKIIEQIAKGLQALHRQEMLHQDLRPNNIMIDKTGTVKIIDFGSVQVAGVAEIASKKEQQHILGTAQYTAPEYFIGEAGTTRSDLFSLGVICYQMFSGRTPYGVEVARATTRSAQHRLVYQSVLDDQRTIPVWIDGAIGKAVHPNPAKRYDTMTEFIYDLRHPNTAFMHKDSAPLLDRNPLLFWKGLSFILFVIVVFFLVTHPALGQ